jgi:hypothetical protein
MKLPKTFVPEKGLEEKVEGLKSGVDDKLSLKDLILKPEHFDGLMHCDKINDPIIRTDYSFLNLSEIEDIISLEYRPKNDNLIYTIYANIVQFKDKFVLEKDIKNIIEKHKHLSLIAHNTTLIRNRYVIFAFMFSGDIYFHNKLVEVYKSEFGFKEVKEY